MGTPVSLSPSSSCRSALWVMRSLAASMSPPRASWRTGPLAHANSTMSFTTRSVTRSSSTLWFWDCSRST